MATANHVSRSIRERPPAGPWSSTSSRRSAPLPGGLQPDLPRARLGQSGRRRNLVPHARDRSCTPFVKRKSAGRDVAGIGIVNHARPSSSQSKDEQAVSPAIVWQSRQSQPQVEALLCARHGDGLPSTNWPRCRRLFHSNETGVAPRGEPDLRIERNPMNCSPAHRFLAALESNQAKCTQRRFQCLQNDALRTSDARMVTEPLHDLAIPLQMLPTSSQARVSPVLPHPLFGAEIPVSGIAGDHRPRSSGRPAPPRGGQEALEVRDRLIPPAEHRHELKDQPTSCSRPSPGRSRAGRLRTRGLGLH